MTADRAVRVLMLTPDGLGGQGGIARVSGYIADYLAAHRPDVALHVRRARWGKRALVKHATAVPALLAFALDCLRGVDVVHINVAPRGSTWRKMVFARTAALLGKPVVLHLHGSGYDAFFAGLSPGRQARVRGFFRRAAAVVTLSPYWTAFAANGLGVPSERLHEIPNGVPDAGAVPAASGDAVPVIAALGLVGPRKGTDILIEALGLIAAQGVPFRALIGGNGAVDQARGQAAARGLGDAVEFLGWIGEAEVDRVLRAATVFVLPSRAENQPVAILEAMARARAVVASAVGAIPEQVVDGETGLLVPPADAPALAAALTTLLTDRDRADRMGEAGLRRYRAHFSVAACADRFAALYHAVARA